MKLMFNGKVPEPIRLQSVLANETTLVSDDEQPITITFKVPDGYKILAINGIPMAFIVKEINISKSGMVMIGGHEIHNIKSNLHDAGNAYSVITEIGTRVVVKEESENKFVATCVIQ